MKSLAVILGILFAAGVSASAQCPAIAVVGPAGVTSHGDKMTFRAQVGIVGPKIGYSWSVSEGIIVGGQGTPVISVATSNVVENSIVTATVEIEGLPSDCEKTGAATAPIAQPPAWCWDLDAYGPIKPNEERARLDAFLAELTNNPTHVGVIVLRITTSERRDFDNRRLRFIVKHAKFRRFDRKRLVFLLELAEDQRTIPIRVIPGGEMPPCEQCLTINGADIQ